VTRRVAISHPATWLAGWLALPLLLAGIPLRTSAQVVSWGSRFGSSESGRWFPAPGQTTHWFCPVPVPCTPPNGGSQAVYIGVFGFTGVGSSRAGINGSVVQNAPVNLPGGSIVLGTGARGELFVGAGARSLTTGSLTIGNQQIRNDFGALVGGQGLLAISGGATVNTQTNSWVGLNAGATGEVRVSGGGSQWNTAGQLAIGNSGLGKLTITDGGAVNVAGVSWISLQRGSQGSVLVAGAGSQWNTANQLIVGSLGPGALTIRAGGTASSGTSFVGGALGSTGVASVSGTGSRWTTALLEVGTTGRGVLTIADGGIVNSVGGDIGVFGAAGAVTVTGANSRWNMSTDLYVGTSPASIGLLAVSDGGGVSARHAWIGNGSTGTLTVNGVGSAVQFGGQLMVGNDGRGVLDIQSGGAVSANAAWVGNGVGSTGTVFVNGPGTKWNVTGGGVVLGSGGTATLDVRNRGIFTAAGSVTVGGANGSTGTMFLRSGAQGSSPFQLVVGGSVGAQGTVTLTGPGTTWTSGGGFATPVSHGIEVGGRGPGTVTVQNGARLVTPATLGVGRLSLGTLNVTSGAMVASHGAVVGLFAGSAGTVLVDAADWANTTSLLVGAAGAGMVKVRNGGHITTGSLIVGAAGVLDIDPAAVDVLGDFTLLPGGVLSIGVSGTAAGLMSQLRIGGAGLFQGLIRVNFMDGFAPAAGDVFSLILTGTGADFSGASFDAGGLAAGFRYDTEFTNGSWSLVARTAGVSTTATPEPTTGALVTAAVFAVAFLRRRGRTRRQYAA
jgi:T5SS/PEP-CTERM-associated repeat protein